MIKKITLLELNKSIQETLSERFSGSVWIIAEISELKVNRNGHCYLELIEKDLINDKIIAKTRATIWSFTYRMLKPYFENTTGQTLSAGLKILVQVNIEFHELYGLSLNITDIDPNYTLGDLAKKKIEILRQLEEDGIIEMNKELPFPIIPQRIAIISSDTAAGYQDFTKQLNNNNYGYTFYTKLFPSIMQGDKAEESIIQSLEKIFEYENLFDIAIIIRGGGSQSDLSCFDSYPLASNIAQFPLPILTGIGHDKDESIADKVAFQQLKTPTAVAEYIINKTLEFDNYLNIQTEQIELHTKNFLTDLKDNLSTSAQILFNVSKDIISKNNFDIKLIDEKIKIKIKGNLKNKYNTLDRKLLLTNNITKNKFTIEQTKISTLKNIFKNKISNNLKLQKQTLEHKNKKLNLLDPIKILKRGYSITYKNNKRVFDVKNFNQKDQVLIQLFNGFIRSTVDDVDINKRDL